MAKRKKSNKKLSLKNIIIGIIVLSVIGALVGDDDDKKSSTVSSSSRPAATRSVSNTPRPTSTPVPEDDTATPTNEPVQVALAQPTATATDTPEPIASEAELSAGGLVFIGEDGLSLSPIAVRYLEKAGSRTPNNDLFAVVFATLSNASDDESCVRAVRVRLYLDGDAYAPQNGVMDEVKIIYENKYDFIGAYAGICVDAGESIPTFVAFDVPAGAEDVEFSFWDDKQPIYWSWETDEFTFDETTADDQAIAAEPTEAKTTSPTATITNTPRPTATATITNTPKPTATKTPVGPVLEEIEPLTVYVRSNNTNVRPCPQLSNECDPVTSLSSGTPLEITAEIEGDVHLNSTLWYAFMYKGELTYGQIEKNSHNF